MSSSSLIFYLGFFLLQVLGLELALATKEINEGKRDLNAKRSMVRHISHEIRTPLNTTSIGVEVLEHELISLGNVIPSSIMEVSKIKLIIFFCYIFCTSHWLIHIYILEFDKFCEFHA